MRNKFGSLADIAIDAASWIDNKPVFAQEYMAEGVALIVKKTGVDHAMAEHAIMYYLETPEGKQKARKYARALGVI